MWLPNLLMTAWTNVWAFFRTYSLPILSRYLQALWGIWLALKKAWLMLTVENIPLFNQLLDKFVCATRSYKISRFNNFSFCLTPNSLVILSIKLCGYSMITFSSYHKICMFSPSRTIFNNRWWCFVASSLQRILLRIWGAEGAWTNDWSTITPLTSLPLLGLITQVDSKLVTDIRLVIALLFFDPSEKDPSLKTYQNSGTDMK